MNIPTLVTLVRIVLIPPIVWLILIGENLPALLLFAFASALDWLDGYLARRLKQHTPLGAMFDHIADKLLVCSTMVVLLYVYPHPAALIATLVVIGRDLLMGGLREFWLVHGTPERSSVNLLGKWKTTIQMLAIGLVLLVHWWDKSNMMWLTQGAYLLVACITLLSLLGYLRPTRATPEK